MVKVLVTFTTVRVIDMIIVITVMIIIMIIIMIKIMIKIMMIIMITIVTVLVIMMTSPSFLIDNKFSSLYITIYILS